jgi:glycosyltransferase involved in cell wall biosynthesis
LVAIREHLRRQGIPCSVINLTRHRKANANEVYYPESAVALVRLLLVLPYDVLHLHLGGDLTTRLLTLSLVCCSIPGKKAVLTFHSGGFPASPQGRALNSQSFAAFVLRRFDAIIGVNAEIVQWMERLGVPRWRLHLIAPHAGELTPATQLSPRLGAFYREHSPVLLSVGLLEPEYDLPAQIDVLGKIRDVWPGAGLVMIGSGSLEDDLRRRIANVPWAAHILLEGDVPHAITLKAIGEASLLLRTTLYDGDAVSVREALHLDTPVIATDNGMRPPGVRRIPLHDPAALEQAILGQLGEQTGRAKMPPEVASPCPSDMGENQEAVLNVYKAVYNALQPGATAA